MEYLRGDSLKEMIAHLQMMPPSLAAHYLLQICDALAYAHERGIIHRDINPSNIIVQPNDQIKILDFGLACPAGTEDFSNPGHALYVAPEQIEGEPVDARTDIYAVGITAFQLPGHYSQSVLDQYVGCGHCQPESGRFRLEPGDLLPLCSDGLHKQLVEEKLRAILNTRNDLKTIAQNLVAAALAAGGADNISLIMAMP